MRKIMRFLKLGLGSYSYGHYMFSSAGKKSSAVRYLRRKSSTSYRKYR